MTRPLLLMSANHAALGFLTRAKSIIPHRLRKRLSDLWVIRWLRLWFTYHLSLKPKLVAQLRLASVAHVRKPCHGKRVLVTLIESSHYQFYQVLILAKALELRGAEIKVLLCGSRLDGCEIKSVNKINDPDPCLSCRFNQRTVVPHFNLPVVQLADFVSDEEVASMRKAAADIALNSWGKCI